MSNEIVGAQYVYITIPKSDVKLYHRLMSLMADYGEAKLKDCTAECLRNNQLVINAYNMFNAAIAAKSTNTTLYNTLIKYVDAAIENLYKGQASENLDDIGFVYESDEHGNVVIDIERSILITEDGTWSLVPYEQEPVISRIEYTIENIVFNDYTISAAGGSVNKASNTPTYRHWKTIYYEDGREPLRVDAGNVIEKYELVEGDFTVGLDSGNLSGIEASYVGSTHNIGKVRVTLTSAVVEEGYTGASETKIAYVKQSAYVEPNRLVYAEIPVTISERNAILAAPDSITNYITAANIAQYKVKDSSYIAADNSISTTNDVIQIAGQTVGSYIQVFLIKNTHTLVGYDELGGSSINLYQVPIENLNTYSVKKIVDNYSDFDNSIFRLVALLDKQDSNKQFKIQIKNN